MHNFLDFFTIPISECWIQCQYNVFHGGADVFSGGPGSSDAERYGWACSPSEAQIKQVVVEEIFDAGAKAGEGAEDEEGAEEDFSPAI